jgi:hypothetical protein
MEPWIAPYKEQLARLGLDKKIESGDIFKLVFRRLTDKVVDGQVIVKAGEPWTLTCRFGVRKGVKGADPGRRDRDMRDGYITVFSMEPNGRGFRRIKLDTIIEVK